MNQHAMVVKPDSRKNMAVLTGRLGPHVFEIAREMPGRRRWQNRDLLFELTRANIEFLQEKLPDAIWEVDRGDIIERLQQLEADAIAAKTRDLPPEASNFKFKTTPRDHQRKAFMLSKDRKAYAWFLEQGLGKTKVGLDNAAYLWSIGLIDTLMIDAPNGVHKQWIEEQLPIHLPDWVPHKAVVYKSPSNQTKALKQQIEDVFDYHDGLRIFAVHHDASANEAGAAFLRRILSSGKVLWIIDESSRKIKTPGAQRTKTTLKLRDLASFRRLGDGTPVTKGVEDLFTQLKFLSDDVHGFSSFYTYRNRYCKVRQVPGAPTGVVEIYGYQNLEELQKRMDGWSLRLRSDECLDLPERTYVTRYVEMTDDQKRLYAEMKNEFITQIDSGEVVSAEQAVVKLLRLQQILCGHVKDDDGRIHTLKSNRHLEALAAAQQSQGAKCIVWARFHHDIDLLAKTFREEGYAPVTWDGRTSTDDRAIAKNRFIGDPAIGPFIANPGSAGIGTDGLQHASHTAIWFSNTFKATERWQGDARLYRDGQRGTVNNVDLVVPNTVDVHILRTLKNRQDIAFKALDVREWLI
jgi:hypothetical protein